MIAFQSTVIPGKINTINIAITTDHALIFFIGISFLYAHKISGLVDIILTAS